MVERRTARKSISWIFAMTNQYRIALEVNGAYAHRRMGKGCPVRFLYFDDVMHRPDRAEGQTLLRCFASKTGCFSEGNNPMATEAK